MIHLKLYGTGTSTHYFIKQCLVEYFTFHNIDYDIEEITEVSRFLQENIMSVPYVVFDDKAIGSFTFDEDLHSNIKNIYRSISISKIKFNIRKLLLIDFDKQINNETIFVLKSLCKNKYYHINFVEYTSNAIPNEKHTNFSNEITTKLESDFIGSFSNNITASVIEDKLRDLNTRAFIGSHELIIFSINRLHYSNYSSKIQEIIFNSSSPILILFSNENIYPLDSIRHNENGKSVFKTRFDIFKDLIIIEGNINDKPHKDNKNTILAKDIRKEVFTAHKKILELNKSNYSQLLLY